ncbi:MAG: biotin transporter BioY [Thaumarchaeota archaeon]|nr:biotin transporter BioY [Nitrososphaerota archaeon]
MRGSYPRSRRLTLAITFAALISVASPISIPIGPVPITLQVFLVFLALALLGPWYGTLSMLIYLLLGATGIPVFAGLSSGVGVLLGPTGGYLFGFALACLLGGQVVRRRASTRRLDLIRVSVGCLAGLVVIYLVGVVWLSYYLPDKSLSTAILYGALPFIPIDLLKAVVAVPLAVELRWSYLQLPVNRISS